MAISSLKSNFLSSEGDTHLETQQLTLHHVAAADWPHAWSAWSASSPNPSLIPVIKLHAKHGKGSHEFEGCSFSVKLDFMQESIM